MLRAKRPMNALENSNNFHSVSNPIDWRKCLHWVNHSQASRSVEFIGYVEMLGKIERKVFRSMKLAIWYDLYTIHSFDENWSDQSRTSYLLWSNVESTSDLHSIPYLEMNLKNSNDASDKPEKINSKCLTKCWKP